MHTGFYKSVYDDGEYKVPVPRTRRTNHLLVNPVLATVKPTTWNLPQSDHTYGYSNPVDMEGAAELLSNWSIHQPNAQRMPGSDFVALNKYASMNGCTTAKNVSSFRQMNDIRLEESNYPVQGNTYYPDNQTVYGCPSVPSASIHALVTNSYQRSSIEQRRNMESTRMAARQTRKRNQVPRMTKAALGHFKVPAPAAKARFTMRQFQNVPGRVSQQMYANTTRPTPVAGRRSQSAGAPQGVPEPMYQEY